MSVQSHFGAAIVKVGVAIGQCCLRVEIIAIPVFGGVNCSRIEDVAS